MVQLKHRQKCRCQPTSSLSSISMESMAESRLHCMTQAVPEKRQLLKLSMQVEARAEVEVPEHLISAEHLDQLMAEHQPRFLPTATSITKEDIPDIPSDEPSEQIMQFKLSNGIKVNARRTLNEPKAAMLRMIAAGDAPIIRPSHSVGVLYSSPFVRHLRYWRQSGDVYQLVLCQLVA